MTTHHTAKFQDKELLPKVGCCGRVTVWLYLIKARALTDGATAEFILLVTECPTARQNYFCSWCKKREQLFWNIISISSVYHFKIAWSPHAVLHSDGLTWDRRNHVIQFAPPFERTRNCSDWKTQIWNGVTLPVLLDNEMCISQIDEISISIIIKLKNIPFYLYQ